MQHYWLNKQNNDKLIIFFAGWSFDENPFKFLDCGDYDVLMFYDYNVIARVDETIWKNYDEISLLAWSFGVQVAYLLRNKLPNFTKKVAINGTSLMIHDNFGIPEKIFSLTLKYAESGLRSKFYQNVFDKDYEYYQQTPIQRSIENRMTELETLAKLKIEEYKPFYNFAIVSNDDKIIPTKNQINFWKKNPPVTEFEILRHTPLTSGAKCRLLESGHFPFYNFKSWEEIIDYAS